MAKVMPGTMNITIPFSFLYFIARGKPTIASTCQDLKFFEMKTFKTLDPQ